jgi:hypothetical protein
LTTKNFYGIITIVNERKVTKKLQNEVFKMNCYLIETFNPHNGKNYYPQLANTSTEAREHAQRVEDSISDGETKVLGAVLMTDSEVYAAGVDTQDFEDYGDDFDFDGEDGAFEGDSFYL